MLINMRNAMFAGGGSDLPAGLTAVEYLETDRSGRHGAFIDTGYYQNPDTEYEAILMQTYDTTTLNIGNIDTSSSTHGWRLSLHARIYQDWGNSRISINYSSIPGTKFFVQVRDGFLYVKDMDGDFEKTATGKLGKSTSTSPMYIFRQPGATNMSTDMRLYWLRITENQIPIREYIPVRFMNEQEDNEGALYDRVSGQLFRNQGNGTFVIGPDVSAVRGGGV